MRICELLEAGRWGVYDGPGDRHGPVDGSQSPLTGQGTKDWQQEPDFFKKWFSRPYLTNGPTKTKGKS
jgi:hypothetical protein